MAKQPQQEEQWDNDPIEQTDEYKKIIKAAETKIQKLLDGVDKNMAGYNYLYWAAKKDILLKDFDIVWNRPRPKSK